MNHSSDLTVVLCHGSYHNPAPYMPLVEALKANGIDAYCPQLPTADLARLNVGDVNNPDFELGPPADGYPQGEEDAAAVIEHRQQEGHVWRDHRYLLRRSLHYSCWRVRPPFLPTERWFFRSSSVHAVPRREKHVNPSSFYFHLPTCYEQKHDGADLGIMVEPEKYLFGDLSPEDARQWTKVLTASPILTTKLSNDAYAALPCAYLILEGDMTLPKEY
ncbi:Alpha/Beta hydrolase protein [Xylariaceae sp. FL1651]|nr:Alpha/Beta hydrolase protein [Xylariaceae sp. FL1651]